MRVALNGAGSGDAGEARLLEGGYIARTAIAHAGTQSPDILVHHFRQRAFEGDAPDNAFGDQLLNVIFHILEVAVFGAFLHSFEGAHAAIGLEFAPFVDNRLTWGLLHARKEGASHNGISAGGNGFDDVASVTDAAIGNEGDFHGR